MMHCYSAITCPSQHLHSNDTNSSKLVYTSKRLRAHVAHKGHASPLASPFLRSNKGRWRQAAIRRYDTELSFEDTKQTFNTTIAFPSHGGLSKAPVVLFLNGASCESWEYTNFLDELVTAGFVTIVTDVWQPVGPEYPARPEGCPKDKMLMISTAILEPILSFLAAVQGEPRSPDETALREALAQADPDSIVLVGHSWGGVIAIELMDGSASNIQSASIEKLKGAIFFEGGHQGRDSIPLQKSQFISYMSSTLAEERIRSHFDKTKGTKDFIVLRDCNHYGIINFDENQQYMVPTCAIPMKNESDLFQTTEARQKKVIATVADITVLEIKARVMQDKAASTKLQELEGTYKLVDQAIISPV